MNSITFQIDDAITIQLVDGVALFWIDGLHHPPDIEITIDELKNVLSTAGMLITETK